MAPLALLALLACDSTPSPTLNAEQRALLNKAVIAEAPADMIGIEARFGDAIALVGYRLKPRDLTQTAGSELTLTLVWRCERAPKVGYQFFTHLTDARGRLLANLDEAGPLRHMDGVADVPLPPSHCTAGRYLLDELRVPIPKVAPPKIQLRVGLYRDTERLYASGGAVLARERAAVIKLSVRGGTKNADSVPQLDVSRVAEPPTIDGELSDPAWAKAARTTPFVHAGSGAALSKPPRGRARVCYDEQHLYIAFEVEDHQLRGGFPVDAVDPHLWTRDTVEIMVDPDGDGDNRDYYEIQINPQNLVFDSHFERYNLPRGGNDGPFGNQQWRAELRSAVKLRGSLDDNSDRDEGYTVEVAIPWKSFHKAKHAPPRPGDQWRMNFYAMQNNGGAGWSPILGKGNFHRASRFGRVIFR